MKSSLIGESFAETDEAIFYHGFKIGGQIFSALNYIVFNHEKRQFFGKIQSIFFDKILEMNRAEITIFQFPCKEGIDRGNEEYSEIWMVQDNTMEISLSAIESTEVSIVHVPPSISDDQLLEYVSENIGKYEHSEERDSDEESDDEMSDFIIKGEIFGFYQYSVDANEKLHYAPPPIFADKFMSFQTTEMAERLTHEFVEHIKYDYIVSKLDCFKDKTGITTESLFEKLLMQQYTIKNNKFYLKSGNSETRLECDIEKTKNLTAFVFLLKTMLTQDEAPCLSDMYNFCLKFEMNV